MLNLFDGTSTKYFQQEWMFLFRMVLLNTDIELLLQVFVLYCLVLFFSVKFWLYAFFMFFKFEMYYRTKVKLYVLYFWLRARKTILKIYVPLVVMFTSNCRVFNRNFLKKMHVRIYSTNSHFIPGFITIHLSILWLRKRIRWYSTNDWFTCHQVQSMRHTNMSMEFQVFWDLSLIISRIVLLVQKPIFVKIVWQNEVSPKWSLVPTKVC